MYFLYVCRSREHIALCYGFAFLALNGFKKHCFFRKKKICLQWFNLMKCYRLVLTKTFFLSASTHRNLALLTLGSVSSVYSHHHQTAFKNSVLQKTAELAKSTNSASSQVVGTIPRNISQSEFSCCRVYKDYMCGII